MWNVNTLFSFFCIEQNIEFSCSSIGDNKLLFTFLEDKNNHREKISNFLRITNQYRYKQEIIFNVGKRFNLPLHISFDFTKKQTRLYLGTYHLSLKVSQKIVSFFARQYHSEDMYSYEKNLKKIDCIGFNLGTNISMKIYEIVSGEQIGIPKFLKKTDIKEYGILKDIAGRRKIFLRFHTPLDYSIFAHIFPEERIDSLQNDLGSLYTLQKKVKYYCREGEKQEIYFI